MFDSNAALQNAAMIGHEWPADARTSMLHRAGDVALAAHVMATLEATPGFHWNEDDTTDWETACATIARHIARRPHESIPAVEIMQLVCHAVGVA